MANLVRLVTAAIISVTFVVAQDTSEIRSTSLKKGQSSENGQGPVFRLNVRQVPLDVVVQDKHGNPVRGLKESDFIVEEDGTRQHVLSFDWMDGARQSLATLKLPALPANTFMNVPPSPERGPLYVLYYDLVNTSEVDQMTFRQELLKFVDEAQLGTRIALFVNGKGLHMLQGFTTDHALLREAILRKGPGPHIPDVFIYGDVFGRSDVGAALSILNFMAEYLEGLPGRKNLLWLSGNFPIPVTPTLAAGTTSSARTGAPPQLYSVGAQGGPQMLDISELARDGIKQTYAALMRSQVALYPIDVRGVVGALGDYEREDMIAAATGGHAYYSDNRPHFLIDKAVDHGENYYTLSYAPTNTKFDGSERHVRVRLARRGDYKLTYRTGYFAVSDDEVQHQHKNDPVQARFLAAKATDNLYANMEHGAPILHDLLFSAHVSTAGGARLASAEQMLALEDTPAYFRTRRHNKPPKPLPPIMLQKYVIDYGVIDPQLRAAAARKEKAAMLEFAAAAYDDEGRQMNSLLNQGVPTGTGGHRDALFHAIQELEVPPGAAFIRLAVRDTLTNRTGTLEVRLPLAGEQSSGNAE